MSRRSPGSLSFTANEAVITVFAGYQPGTEPFTGYDAFKGIQEAFGAVGKNSAPTNPTVYRGLARLATTTVSVWPATNQPPVRRAVIDDVGFEDIEAVLRRREEGSSTPPRHFYRATT